MTRRSDLLQHWLTFFLIQQIASFTYGECGTKNIPDVFTLIPNYFEWIQSQLNDNACDGNQQSPSPTPSPPTTAAPTVSLLQTASSQPCSSSPAPTPEPTSFKDRLGAANLLTPVFGNVFTSMTSAVDFNGGLLEHKRQWFQNKFLNREGSIFGRHNDNGND